jgi:ferrochelatase
VTATAEPRPPIGILLANLGTPSEPTPSAVRAYLRQLLADPWVVDVPRLRWFLVRHLFVLPWRPRRIASKYRSIWTDGGSPLLLHARRQADRLQAALEELLEVSLQVEIGMRYGNPSLARGLRPLRDRGCRRVLLLPLFPQYSGTTIGSTIDAVAREVAGWREVPELRNAYGYATQDDYIGSLAESVTEVWQREGPAERLLMSFHGLPQRYADAGDPYPEQCRATAELLASSLGLESNRWRTSFQSRFGREEWCGPFTDETLLDWGRERIDSVDVVCPGFAADCLETLEEVAVGGREIFESAGGGRYRYIPSLNDRDHHIDGLARIARNHLSGWT